LCAHETGAAWAGVARIVIELLHVMSNSTIDEAADVRKGLCEDLTFFPPNMHEMRRRKNVVLSRSAGLLVGTSDAGSGSAFGKSGVVPRAADDFLRGAVLLDLRRARARRRGAYGEVPSDVVTVTPLPPRIDE
jgi:hypothetical protein